MIAVELISTSGKSAGIVARVSAGYWMIGRDKECQIRPRTSSVSERHCLLHNTEKVLGIFDLESEKGTFVNDDRLAPHQWRKLEDGDVIRCGKASFTVAIRQTAPKQSVQQDTSKAKQEPETQRQPAQKDEKELVHASDVVSDEVALSASGLTDLASATGSEVSADWFDKNINLSDKNGEVIDPGEVTDAAVKDAEEVDIFADDTMVEDDGDPTPVDREPKKKKKESKLKKPKVHKVRKSKSRSLPSFSLSFNDPEKLKLIGATVLAIVLLGFVAYQFKSEFSGPTIRVIEGLD